MIWTDGSRYKGLWSKGIQDGIGIMYFTDGSKRAGLFENNVFKSNLKHISDLERYRSKIDPNVLQEIENNVNERGGKNNN